MAEGGGRKWWKYGCFGCVGLIGLFLIVAAVMFGLAWNQVGSEELQSRVLEPEIPELAEPQEASASLPARLPGHLIIDVSGGGEFTLVPAPAGTKLRVEANYDEEQFELTETIHSLDDDDWSENRWSYEVKFGGPGSSLFNALRRILGGATPSITVHVPVDVPLSLEMRLNDGAGIVELGGLWLSTADVTMEKGGMELSISEPTRVPMERITVEATMGGMSVDSLGNASPAVLEFDFSMGGMSADFGGDWRQDCEITFDFSMGGGSLQIPSTVRVVGAGGFSEPAATAGEAAVPTLTFTPESRLDDVQISRY